MTYLKMLAAVAAVSALLTGGVGTASGTTLTSFSPGTYTGSIKAESEVAIELHGSFATVSCGKSAIEGKVEFHSSGTTGGNVSSLAFSECNYPVTVLQPGSLEVHETGEGNGTLTSTDAKIKVQTSVGECVFTTEGTHHIGTLTGSKSTNATLDIGSASIPRTGGSVLCGATGQLTGSYKVTEPSTLYVEAASTSGATLTSPSGTTYTSTVKAESEGAIELHGSFQTVSCGKSAIEGKVEQHGSGVTAGGKVSSLTFAECNYSVTVIKPGSLEIHATSGGNGTLTSTGAEIKVHTGVGECIFTTNGTHIGTLTGSKSTNATLDIGSASIPRTGGSFFCGSSGQLTGSYKFSTPSTLYVD